MLAPHLWYVWIWTSWNQAIDIKPSSQALVGGANLVYHPNFMKTLSNFNMLSPDSRSWSFDERANGYARGEGTAVIVVKRLADALRDGDTIRAVIRTTGSNQDGRTPGIMQPSQDMQIELIERTYKQANIDMEPTRFFEAHGTGTPVGDPIEANSIARAFQHCRTMNDPLYIGAVKANIGHLEGCSGLAGIIKALLVLEKGVIPPIAGFELLNHRIDADRLNLHVSPAVHCPTYHLTSTVSEESDSLADVRSSSSLCKYLTQTIPHARRPNVFRSIHSASVAQTLLLFSMMHTITWSSMASAVTTRHKGLQRATNRH